MKVQNLPKAILFALISTFCSASINAIAKSLAPDFDPGTIMFIRNFPILLPLYFWMQSRGIKPQLSMSELRRHAPRAMIGMTSYALLIYAVQHIPLADATAISLSHPFFLIIFAPLLLKEKFALNNLIYVAAGFAGILLVLKPSGDISALSALVIFLHPIFLAFTLISVRFLGRTENAWITVFYYMLFGSIIMTPWAAAHLPPLRAEHILPILGLCTFTLTLQFAQAKSLELAEATAISPVAYSSIIWSLLFANIFWQEWPDQQAWCGILIIVITGLIMKYQAIKRHKAIA